MILHPDAKDAVAQTDAYLAKYDPTEEGLKIVHAAYKNGTLSEPLYLEFTNDLTHRRIREAHPQTPDESGGGEGVRGRVRGGDAGSSEEATGGLRSPLLKGDADESAREVPPAGRADTRNPDGDALGRDTGNAERQPAGGSEANPAAVAKAEPSGDEDAAVKPGKNGTMRVADLALDPNRFQYKLKTDAAGVTDTLKGLKWDPDLAGLIQVWRDPENGKTYVVNGHHRFDLARANGLSKVEVRMLDAPNAEKARSIGAHQNIAGGQGTALDAAKYMRDRGMTPEQLRDEKGLSLKGGIAKAGAALSRLNDRLFNDVVQGRMRENQAIAIGEITSNPAHQDALMDELKAAEKRGKPYTDSELQTLGKMVGGAGEHTEQEQTLFGMFENKRSNLRQKIQLIDHVRTELQAEKRDFGSLAKQTKAEKLAKGKNKINVKNNAEIAQEAAQALEVHDKMLKNTGPIDDIYTRAAGELAAYKGGKPSELKNRVYEEVRSALGKILGNAGTTSNAESAGAGAGEKLPAKVSGTDTSRDRAPDRAGAAEPGSRPRVGGSEESGAREKAARTEDRAVKKPDKGDDEKTDDEKGPPKGPVLFNRGDTLDSMGFYKKSERLIDEKMRGPMPASSVRKMLENAGVKADELKWTGLDDALKGDEKVTPDQLRKVFAEERVKLEEAVKGKLDKAGQWQVKEDRDTTVYSRKIGNRWSYIHLEKNGDVYTTAPGGYIRKMAAKGQEGVAQAKALFDGQERSSASAPTRYQSYQEPGGENYREMLLKLPAPDKNLESDPEIQALRKQQNAGWEARDAAREQHDLKGTEETRQALVNARIAVDRNARKLGEAMDRKRAETFKSVHWDEPNVLAHIRYNDRVTPDGKKLLHLEEVQSDWHQTGRDKGYRGEPDGYGNIVPAGHHFEKNLSRYKAAVSHDLVNDASGQVVGFGQLRSEAIERAGFNPNRMVPDAPFKKTWHELALRRMLRHAAENGYDGMSWTPGEKQADRYSLHKQISSVDYDRSGQLNAYDHHDYSVFSQHVPEDKLADTIGKEAAQKLLAIKPNEAGSRVLSGLDLKVGGEGMKGFYDKIIPDYLNKYGKRWGAKVSEVTFGKKYDRAGDEARKAELDKLMEDAEDAAGTLPDDYDHWLHEHQQISNELHKSDTMRTPVLIAQHIPITEAMRKSVMEEGQSLFAKGKAGTAPAIPTARLADVARHDVIPGDGSFAPMVRVDSFARELVNQAGPGLAPGDQWNGVTLEKGDVDTTVARLEAMGKDLAPAQAENLRGLIQSIKQARDAAGGAIFLARGGEHAIGEEQFHGGQLRTGAHLGDVMLQIGQSPELLKAKDYLAQRGYANNVETAALEATAKIVDGDWQSAGLSKAEGATLLRDFFAAVEKARGPEALKDLKGLAEEIERRRAANDDQVSEGRGTAGSPGPGTGARPEQTGLQFGPGGESFQGGQEPGRPEGADYARSRSGQGALFNRDGARVDARAERTKADTAKQEDVGKPLDELVEGMGKLKGRKMSVGEHMADSIERAADALTSSATSAQKSFAKVKGSLAGVWSLYNEPPRWTDL